MIAGGLGRGEDSDAGRRRMRGESSTSEFFLVARQHLMLFACPLQTRAGLGSYQERLSGRFSFCVSASFDFGGALGCGPVRFRWRLFVVRRRLAVREVRVPPALRDVYGVEVWRERRGGAGRGAGIRYG